MSANILTQKNHGYIRKKSRSRRIALVFQRRRSSLHNTKSRQDWISKHYTQRRSQVSSTAKRHDSFLDYVKARGLDRWKLGKAIEAALSTKRDENEPDERYHKRIMSRSFEETDKAAKLGTRIHDAIDAAFDGVETNEDIKQYVEPTMKYLSTLNLKDIEREGVVVNLKDGYAATNRFARDFREHQNHYRL